MRLVQSMFFGALVTLVIGLLVYGGAVTINFLGKVDPVYSVALLTVAVWIFCTVVFYNTSRRR